MKTFMLSVMLLTAQLTYAQINLDITTSAGALACPAQLKFVVEYDFAGNVPPHPTYTSGCINIGALPTTLAVCPTCTSGEMIFSVQVIDCSNAANNATVGDSNSGFPYSLTGVMPGPVSCTPSANNLLYTPAGAGTNPSVDITP